MPKCNKCGTIYNETQRQILINKKVYWCPMCSNFKIFNPFPATIFISVFIYYDVNRLSIIAKYIITEIKTLCKIC